MSRYRECRLDWFTSRNHRRTRDWLRDSNPVCDVHGCTPYPRYSSATSGLFFVATMMSLFPPALLEFGNPTPIERAWPFSAQHDRLIVVGDRFVEVAHFQVYEPATVECIRVVRPQTQRLIAIFQRLF